MSTLKIIAYGLMAFVPTTKPGAVPGMTVLLANASNTNVSNLCPLAHHHPFVAFEAGSCSGSAADCAWLARDFQKDPVPKFSGSWELRSEEFVVDFPSGPVTVHKPMPPPSGELPGSQLEAKAFSWVADMNTLTYPLTPHLKPSCLTDGNGCKILGRFEIPSGEVTTCHLAQDPQIPYKGFVHSFDFQQLLGGKSTAPPQALADIEQVQLSIARPLRIWTHSFKDKKPTHDVTLRPGADGEIRLYVLDVPTPRDESHCSGNGIADHFERFYELVDWPTGSPKRYVPMETSNFSQDDVQPPDPCVAPFISFIALTDKQRTDARKGARLDPHSPRVPPVCPPVVIHQ